MTVAELIEELGKLEGDSPVSVSIDVSTSEEDAGRRAFSEMFFEAMDSSGEVVLCFDGYLNDECKGE